MLYRKYYFGPEQTEFLMSLSTPVCFKQCCRRNCIWTSSYIYIYSIYYPWFLNYQWQRFHLLNSFFSFQVTFLIFGFYITISLWVRPTPNIFTLLAPFVSFSRCHSVLPFPCLSLFLLSATFCREFSCVKLSPVVAYGFTRNKPMHFLNPFP